MKRLLIILLHLSVLNSFAQSKDTINERFDSAKELNDEIEKGDFEPTVYVDYTYGFKVKVPEWLKVMSPGENGRFGGTLPAIDGIQNAIMVTSYDIGQFESIEHMKKVFITGNKFGQPTLYSENHIWYGTNERDLKEIDGGFTSRVFTLYQNAIYHNQFVILKSKKAYLWIQFVATPETYDANLEKFNEFMDGFELLK